MSSYEYENLFDMFPCVENAEDVFEIRGKLVYYTNYEPKMHASGYECESDERSDSDI